MRACLASPSPLSPVTLPKTACWCFTSTEMSTCWPKFGRRAETPGEHCRSHAPNVSLSKKVETRRSLKFDSNQTVAKDFQKLDKPRMTQQHPWLIFSESSFTQRRKVKTHRRKGFLVPLRLHFAPLRETLMLLEAVVRGFLGDDDVVNVRLFETR